jgi:hypothetical protein
MSVLQVVEENTLELDPEAIHERHSYSNSASKMTRDDSPARDVIITGKICWYEYINLMIPQSGLA